MGCTVVALVVQGADLTIGHVGDSRAYLIRGGRATQLTLDHSWVAMQVHEGILTPEQAEHHPNRSVLMRALGRYPSVEVDIGTRRLQPGDILLVCSDGLTGMVTDEEIAEYATRIPPASLPHQLIELANSRGAPDNVTVLIGAISGSPTATQAAAVAPPATVSDPNSTTTLISAPHDARTPRMEPPPGDTPTNRNLQKPQADATIPMGVLSPNLQTGPTMAAGPRQTGPRQAVAPPAAGAPLGKPVVVARSSVIQTEPAGRKSRRGRGRWIAGAVAAFGLAGALVLLSVFQLTRESSSTASTASAPTTPAPVAAAPAAPPPQPTVQAAQPKPAAPGASGNPALLPPAPAAATPLPTSVAQKPAASPSAASLTPTRAIPSVPSIPGIFGTPVPTSTPGQRTGAQSPGDPHLTHPPRPARAEHPRQPPRPRPGPERPRQPPRPARAERPPQPPIRPPTRVRRPSHHPVPGQPELLQGRRRTVSAPPTPTCAPVVHRSPPASPPGLAASRTTATTAAGNSSLLVSV